MSLFSHAQHALDGLHGLPGSRLSPLSTLPKHFYGSPGPAAPAADQLYRALCQVFGSAVHILFDVPLGEGRATADPSGAESFAARNSKPDGHGFGGRIPAF